MKKVHGIVAVSNDGGMGINNEMPWYLPGDLKYFKETTLESVVIMGRKTAESVGKPLPYRLNIVLSKNKEYKPPEGFMKLSNIEQAINWAPATEQNTAYIIGGAEIFKQYHHLIDRLYLTKIDEDFECDVFFPMNILDNFKMTFYGIMPYEKNKSNPNGYKYGRFIYDKIKE